MRALSKLIGPLAIVLLVLSGSPAKADNNYGALAHNDKTGAFGWAVDRPSKNAASHVALHKCGHGCKVVTVFWNTCAAYATGHHHVWGWSAGDSNDEAKRRAVSKCSDVGTGCRAKVWACAKN